MRQKDMVLGGVLSVIVLFGGLVFAQQGMGKVPPPNQNVSEKRHPNLAAAQHHLDMAFEKIQAAQQANEFDLDGHAAKAKELIDQADKELKQAARTSNQNHK
jgi:F0F1-type ATP synthase membrane subunit b/b'